MATGVVVGLTDFPAGPAAAVSACILVAYTLWRTLRPLPRSTVGEVDLARLGVELGVGLAAVTTTGGWDSPFVLTLLIGVLLAGFSRGYRGGLLAAGVSSAGLALATLLAPSARATPEAASQVVLVYFASGVVAGYARRLFLEAEEREEVFTDRMARLSEANALLSQLTQVTQTLPSSLDLGDTVAAAIGHLRQLFDFSGAAIMVLDASTGTWRPEAAAGLPLPAALRTESLPSAARAAISRSVVVYEPALDPDGGRQGLSPTSRSALYGALSARQRVVALAVLEHDEPGRFGNDEAAMLSGLAEPMALAIDNALWFERLRTLGAEGERDRLARNLHDRIGQGLAYVSLELERIARLPEPADDLGRLRSEVGSLLAEVRETLRQLRSRVTEAAGLAGLADAYLPRFSERTGIRAAFNNRAGTARLPVPVEQELWRMLQEALSNVERHSQATSVTVDWQVEEGSGRLEVVDDGVGFDPESLDDLAPSGIMAMRERANAIGARLRITSWPSQGTHVVAEVEVGG